MMSPDFLIYGRWRLRLVSHVQVIGVGRVFWGCGGTIQKKSIYLHVATVVADIENNLKNTALHGNRASWK